MAVLLDNNTSLYSVPNHEQEVSLKDLPTEILSKIYAQLPPANSPNSDRKNFSDISRLFRGIACSEEWRTNIAPVLKAFKKIASLLEKAKKSTHSKNLSDFIELNANLESHQNTLFDSLIVKKQTLKKLIRNFISGASEEELNAVRYFPPTDYRNSDLFDGVVKNLHSKLFKSIKELNLKSVDSLLKTKGIDVNIQFHKKTPIEESLELVNPKRPENHAYDLFYRILHDKQIDLSKLAKPSRFLMQLSDQFHSSIYATVLKTPGIKLNVPVNFLDETPLHQAISCLNTNLALELLEIPGIDINSKDCDKETPLHYAVKFNLPKVIDRLLSHKKIKHSAKNDDGETPLFLAAKLEKAPCLNRLLKNKRVNVNEPNRKGKQLFTQLSNKVT